MLPQGMQVESHEYQTSPQNVQKPTRAGRGWHAALSICILKEIQPLNAGAWSHINTEIIHKCRLKQQVWEDLNVPVLSPLNNFLTNPAKIIKQLSLSFILECCTT